MSMIEKQFMRLVLKALYIIMMTQGGFSMGMQFAKWDIEHEDFLEVLGE